MYCSIPICKALLARQSVSLKFKVWILADPSWLLPFKSSTSSTEYSRTTLHPFRRKRRGILLGETGSYCKLVNKGSCNTNEEFYQRWTTFLRTKRLCSAPDCREFSEKATVTCINVADSCRYRLTQLAVKKFDLSALMWPTEGPSNHLPCFCFW